MRRQWKALRLIKKKNLSARNRHRRYGSNFSELRHIRNCVAKRATRKIDNPVGYLSENDGKQEQIVMDMGMR